jgi:hypothetical protein
MFLYSLTSFCFFLNSSSIAAGPGPLLRTQIYRNDPRPVPSRQQRLDAAIAFARLEKNDF